MFFNMDEKDLAFIKQPVSKKKDGTNEPGLNSKIHSLKHSLTK